MSWIYLVSVIGGYLLGSIPTGYLVGRRYGIDIREHGSRNIGATNVVRVLGKRPGYLVFFCDAIKGWLAVFIGKLIVINAFIVGTKSEAETVAALKTALGYPGTLAVILAGLACILGHNFPVWLRFRGGKGVATTIGVLLGLMPAAFAVAAVVWAVSFFATRYVSLASMLAAAALPVAVWWMTRHDGPISGPGAPMFWFSVVAALLIILRHRSNIGRLLQGTESRFDRKPSTPSAPPAV